MAGRKGDFLIKDAQTVVLIGDSITDCGRRNEAFPFGNGYASMVINLITARYPDRRITFFNEGIGGDIMPGLRNRWSDDVIVHEPDWVSVLVGINDIHRTCFNPNKAEQVPVDLYRKAYEQALTRTTDATKARIILMDPFYISTETDTASPRSKVLSAIGDYISVVREMASRFDAIHIPLHDVFRQQLEHRPPDAFCPEPVHPNVRGHLIIAEAWLSAVGW